MCWTLGLQYRDALMSLQLKGDIRRYSRKYRNTYINLQTTKVKQRQLWETRMARPSVNQRLGSGKTSVKKWHLTWTLMSWRSKEERGEKCGRWWKRAECVGENKKRSDMQEGVPWWGDEIGQVDGECPHPSNGTPRTMAMSYICPVQYGCGDSAAQLGSAHLRN